MSSGMKLSHVCKTFAFQAHGLSDTLFGTRISSSFFIGWSFPEHWSKQQAKQTSTSRVGPRRVYIPSGGPNGPSITVSSEIEPYYRDLISTLFQVLILHPLPHWQVVLGAIAIWFLLSPKWDFHFVFKGISHLNKHLLLCEKSHSGEALSPRISTV